MRVHSTHTQTSPPLDLGIGPVLQTHLVDMFQGQEEKNLVWRGED